ncbi:MAG: hypothetical protein V1790_04085 [Planctomycetota bacterium]
MRYSPRRRRILKWIGTVACVLLVTGFLYSTRRAIGWVSLRAYYEVSLQAGGIAVCWRPADWRPDSERYPAQPGWSVAKYGGPDGSTTLIAGIECSSNRSWQGVGVALWIPFLPTLLVTGTLWYHDRKAIRSTWDRLERWLRPPHRRRITLRLILASILAHGVGVVIGLELFGALWNFFLPSSLGWLMGNAWFGGAVIVLLWGSPIWGVCWAWGVVRYRNALLTRFPGPGCVECGYDLTGNTSGRCPECGSLIPPSTTMRPAPP